MLERLKTEEGLINAIVLASWIFLMPIIAFRLFSEFAVLAVALFALVLVSMLVVAIISRKSGSLKGLKSDERTEKYTMKAARNGFLMTVGLTAFLTVLTWFRGSHLEALDLLIWIWLWATAAYQLSYMYYVMKG